VSSTPRKKILSVEVYKKTHAKTHTQTDTHEHKHAGTHKHAHTHKRKDKHTNTQAHKHVYTHTQSVSCDLPASKYDCGYVPSSVTGFNRGPIGQHSSNTQHGEYMQQASESNSASSCMQTEHTLTAGNLALHARTDASACNA